MPKQLSDRAVRRLGRLFGIEKANSYPWGELLESVLSLATLPAVLAAARERKTAFENAPAVHIVYDCTFGGVDVK